MAEQLQGNMLRCTLEAILFASGDPIHISRLCQALELEQPVIEKALQELGASYKEERRGIRLQWFSDRYQLCTAPEHADAIRKALEIRKQTKLSRPSLEVLTIVAYFQPITRARIEEIRGIDCTYIISLLVEMGLIEKFGQLNAPGAPNLYRTTMKFLRDFQLHSLADLPEIQQDNKEPEEELLLLE